MLLFWPPWPFLLIQNQSYYLAPLSYGIPSAFGARECCDVNASTIRDTIYGNMLYTVPEIGNAFRNPIPIYTFDNDLNNANSTAAPAIRSGFH